MWIFRLVLMLAMSLKSQMIFSPLQAKLFCRPNLSLKIHVLGILALSTFREIQRKYTAREGRDGLRGKLQIKARGKRKEE